MADTRGLLERVDQRRRVPSPDRRRWDHRADVLEEALIEGRRRIARIALTIQDLGKQLDGLRHANSGSLAHVEAFPRDEPDALPEQRRLAAERVLGAPVLRIENMVLEDFALAKAFLESAGARGMPRDQREELVRRIGIYDRRAERDAMASKPRLTIEERRQQVLLRGVIDKCRAGSFAMLTLGEIDLLIHSYDLLVKRPDEFDADDRLLEIVNRAVDEICARWANLDRLREALSSRR